MLPKAAFIGTISIFSVLAEGGFAWGELPHPLSSESMTVRVFVTAQVSGDKLAEKTSILLASETSPAGELITLDHSRKYQSITGFGGSFTESTAYTLSKMSPDKRAEVLKAYFDPEGGIGYTLCRTHINSSDFSLGNYAYDDVDGDFELQHFDISRDRKWLIPLIKDAMAVAGANFKLFASPWSPPAWMKTNGQMNYGGQLKSECRDVWATLLRKIHQRICERRNFDLGSHRSK